MTPSPSVDPDLALVRSAQAGQQRAFEMLVVKYQRRIERLIARFVRDADLVSDLAQEAFLQAWRALPQFRGEAAFYTWLYRIAVNVAKKSLQHQKRDPLAMQADLNPNSDDDETFFAGAEPSTEDTPEALVASRQMAQALEQGLQALSEDLRQALVLREMEGMSYEEIAVQLACPIGTVRSRIFRAREFLAQKLAPHLSARAGKRW